MKSTSGKPYIKPSGRPTFRLVNDSGVVIEAFETYNRVEIFQTTNGHEQRLVMSPSQFDNFYSVLQSSGFVSKAGYHETSKICS